MLTSLSKLKIKPALCKDTYAKAQWKTNQELFIAKKKYHDKIKQKIFSCYP